MRTFFFMAGICWISALPAQPPQSPAYSVDNITLPAEFNKQVCISGMKYYDDKLYFASERSPVIFAADKKGNITNTINLQVPQFFEMEGMTSYKNKLYTISENIAAVYEINPQNGSIKTIQISITLPPKSKNGDGMEGIAANEKSKKFYLLRERNEDMTKSQLYTFSIEAGNESSPFTLNYETIIELPLESPQWRYSDICLDAVNSRLICLKSYAKGSKRQQFLESINIDNSGKLLAETLKNIPVENFTETSNTYKSLDYSMNLEGITIDDTGNIYIVSDNTSGKAQCEREAKEKTILLLLKKK